MKYGRLGTEFYPPGKRTAEKVGTRHPQVDCLLSISEFRCRRLIVFEFFQNRQPST